MVVKKVLLTDMNSAVQRVLMTVATKVARMVPRMVARMVETMDQQMVGLSADLKVVKKVA